MGRKSKKGGGGARKPPRPEAAGGAPPPPPTNADWEDSTAAFRKEAEAAIRARPDDGGAAAARLAERHPSSPLAHHVLGHARASAARAADAVPALRRAAELAPRCPGIAATLASALLYARRPREALAECARALAVADPTDPALHAVAAAPGRRGSLSAQSPHPQARVAAARERLLGVRADAEILEATGRFATAPPPVMAPTTKMTCCCRHATKRSAVTDDDLRGFLTVSFDDLAAHCDDQTGSSVHLLTRAVEFAKSTKAWAYWLCPVCDSVFLDANSFVSHVEGEYIHELQELQPLMPKRAALDLDEFQFTLKWTPFEIGEEDPERRKNLDKIKEVFSCLNAFNALPVSLMDKVVKLARGRSKKPLPYCIPSCATSLDSRELQRLVKPLEQLQLHKHLSRGWEFVRGLGNEGKKKGRSEIISLVQDECLLLSLDAEKIVSREKDGPCEEDEVFRWLLNSLEEVVMPWASLRQKCVHHGNEVMERIYEISDSLKRQSILKCAANEKNHRGYSLTEADAIDVEMLLLDNEVGHLKNKLEEVCTFDYSAAILPLLRAYIWDKLNNLPGEESRDQVDKNNVKSGNSLDGLHVESLFEDKIPDTDSDMRFTISRTDECENSSFSQSDSSNFSTFENESFSIDIGVATVLHITADDLQFLNVTLRALWHLREFHDRFLNMPCVLPHFTVEAHCIVCLLRKIFNAWDTEKDYGVTSFPSDLRTAFSDILNERNLFGKEGVNIASEIVSTIFDALHKSHASLHSDNPDLEHKAISSARCLDFVCVAHNVFGLPIREQKKCNCLDESSDGKQHTTFFHSVDVSAIQTTEMKSLGQFLRDTDKQNQYDTESCPCGNKTERSLQSAPPIFAVVFNWENDKESAIDMSKVLMSITTPLQFNVLYEVLHRENYNLATAVCCAEEENLCFARKEGKWIIYGSQKIEFADTWESLLDRYHHRNLRPQILFFDCVRHSIFH